MRFYILTVRLIIPAFLFTMPPACADTAIERGAYLVNSVAACAGCHTPKAPAVGALSGGTTFGPSGVVAPNITPDPETGIGSWSDHQIIDAIRNAIRPDGSRIRPPMPQWAYRAMSDTDAAAIVAYLRTVPAVHHAVPARPKGKPIPPIAPVISVPAPNLDTPFARGRYIANALAHCTECHTPAIGAIPDVEHHLDEGGRVFNGPMGQVIAPGITAPSLERYSDDQLARLITMGVQPDGAKLVGPMPVRSYAGLRPADIKALIAYLRGTMSAHRK